ncbi:MAG: hypothetical protein AABX93_00415 [Nanoarchaeota archaeon]
MITYNEIHEAVRKERGEKLQLQSLPKNFIEEVATYLREKKEFSSKTEDEFSDNSIKNKKQLENARTLFKELIFRRREKILHLLLIATETGVSKRDFENMLDFESKMFESLLKSIESSDIQVNSMLLNGKSEFKKSEEISLHAIQETNVENFVEPKKDGSKSSVIFLDDVNEFMDLNGEMLGPFQKGDKVELQNEIANILVEDKKVGYVYP